MAYFSVRTAGLRGQIPIENNISRQTANLADSVESIANSLHLYLNSSAVPIIKSNLRVVASQMRSESAVASSMSSALSQVVNKYETTENRIVGNAEVTSAINQWTNSVEQIIQNLEKEVRENIDHEKIEEIIQSIPEVLRKYLLDVVNKTDASEAEKSAFWEEVGKLAFKTIGKLGPIGGGISLVSNLLTGAYKWNEDGALKLIKDSVGLTGTIAGTVNNWKGWKDLIGLTGKEAKSFKDGMKSFVDKFNYGKATSTSGKVAVVCQWAGTALTFITEGYENFTDAENSKGRAIKETIGEALVDIGESAAIGAAIGSVVPGAGTVVGAAVSVVGTVVVKWGIDAASKAITGKDFGEFVSDVVIDHVVDPLIDGAKDLGKKAIDTAKDVGKEAANLAKEAGKAIGDGAKKAGKAVKAAWGKAGEFFKFR